MHTKGDMNIIFPERDKKFIHAMVEEGAYRNATELVRDAVRRLREQEDARNDRLMAALAAGEKDIREGRTVPYTPELRKQIMEDAIKHAEAGKEPDPDVCP